MAISFIDRVKQFLSGTPQTLSDIGASIKRNTLDKKAPSGITYGQAINRAIRAPIPVLSGTNYQKVTQKALGNNIPSAMIGAAGEMAGGAIGSFTQNLPQAINQARKGNYLQAGTQAGVGGLKAVGAVSPAVYAYRMFPGVYGAINAKAKGQNVSQGAAEGIRNFSTPSTALQNIPRVGKYVAPGTKGGNVVDTAELLAGLFLNKGVDDMAIRGIRGLTKRANALGLAKVSPNAYKVHPEGYGKNVVELRVKKSDLSINDEFPGGEKHYTLNTKVADKAVKTRSQLKAEWDNTQAPQVTQKQPTLKIKQALTPEQIAAKKKLPPIMLTTSKTEAEGQKIKIGKAGSQIEIPVSNQPRTMKVSGSKKASSPVLKLTKNVSYDNSIPKTFNESYSKYIADRDIAQVTATQKAKVLTDIPNEKAQDVINFREGVTTYATPEVKAWASKMNQVYDTLYKDISTKAKSVGVDVGYIKNYVPHYWKQSAEEVQQAFLSAKKKPSQVKGRIIPTYKEGIGLGLTPKFKHPAQMLEQYVRDMERFGAGIDLIKGLKQQGEIITTPRQGYGRIDAPGLGNNLYAPLNISKEVSRLFSPESQTGLGDILSKTAKFSSGLQDITLSGGVPGTPLNAFTIAQMQKELIAGNIVSPFKAVIDSLSIKRTQKFFDTNAPQVKKMLARNVPVRSGYGVDEMIDQSTAKRIFGDGIGNVWGKLINEPTFKRFMPMLQINLFNQVEAGAIKSGIGEKQAADLAAETVRKFYGLTKTDVSAKRSVIGKDLTTSLFFAPHYRESMINMWIETAKAMKNPLALENRMNVRFAIGAVATYMTMNAINEQLNGHGMNENPESKKDKLLIPVGGGQTIGVPFLSSIATIPRMAFEMGRQALQGDISGVSTEGRKALSMAIKPLTDVMANSDYFERNIVEDTDTPSEKLKKQGEYLLKSYVGHPYLRELIELYTKPEKPVYQRLSNAMELPLRFYSTESIELAPFWEKYYKLKAVQEKYDVIRYEDKAKANDYLNENEEAINELNLMKAYLKANYDQEEVGEAPTSLKEYLARAKTEPRYEQSEDAPKTKVDEARLFIQSGITNPIDTYNAIKSGQPIRKMRGDATILERQLGATDKDTSTQKDHRIPLWAGGTNDDKNTYYLSNEAHTAKTAFETPLRKQLENGEISKSKVQSLIIQWHKDNNIQSIAPPIKKPTITVAGEKTSDKTIELLDITNPTLTGNKELDKKLVSKFNGSITTQTNKIVKLYEMGKITKDEAEKELQKLIDLKAKVKKSTGGTTKKAKKPKKPKKITFAKISAKRAPRIKLSFGKLPTLNLKRKRLTLSKKKSTMRIKV